MQNITQILEKTIKDEVVLRKQDTQHVEHENCACPWNGDKFQYPKILVQLNKSTSPSGSTRVGSWRKLFPIYMSTVSTKM